MRFYKIFTALLFSSTFLGGCFNTPEYPNTPQIEFFDIDSNPKLDQLSGVYFDEVVISIKYKDGDGDLGYEQWELDSLEKSDSNTGYNYLIKQFRKSQGKFIEYEGRENNNGYFQRISPEKPGPIEGKISRTIDIIHSFYRYRNDTIRFEIQIRDRAGNLSNTVTTDSVVVNWL